jgi:Domain of unknown function (DUF4203)
VDFLVGLLVLVLGAGVCFFGLRVFFVLLPVWGFLVGFYVGAAGVHAIFGDRFLSTVTGWIIGFIVAIVFALLSYVFWYVGVVIAAGSVGALLGSALMAAFNVDSEWIVFIVSAIGAIIFAIAAFVLALPVFIVIVNTAILGSAAMVSGVLLIFNRIDRQDLGNGTAWAIINESWWWFLVWVALAALGIVFQLRSISEVVLPEDRWTRAPYGPQPVV